MYMVYVSSLHTGAAILKLQLYDFVELGILVCCCIFLSFQSLCVLVCCLHVFMDEGFNCNFP